MESDESTETVHEDADAIYAVQIARAWAAYDAIAPSDQNNSASAQDRAHEAYLAIFLPAKTAYFAAMEHGTA